MANYAYYCLHKLKILPRAFLELDEEEKASVIAFIDMKIESEKKERSKMKGRRK